jgi:Astacin (Peptidase family M12A)
VGAVAQENVGHAATALKGRQLMATRRQPDDDCYGLRSAASVRTGFVSGLTFGVKPVQYSALDGQAVFEGDIVLGTIEQMDEFARRVQAGDALARDSVPVEGVGITGQRYRWPHGLVPYQIDPGLTDQDRVTDAIAHWEANTRIRFVRRTATNAAEYPSFVTFRPGDGCSSSVGMQGGEQFITLGSGCITGSVIHEIGHAVGIWHEQSREDRDSFITINWANIIPGREHNFNQHITDGDDIGAYDFASIMHYPATAFSVNGQPTIVAHGGEAIGQRSGLSAGDIAAVRALYPQLEPSRTWSGVLFSERVTANQTKSWFSRGWPAHWTIVWTVVPTGPVQDAAPQIALKTRVERQTDALIKYWLVLSNLTGSPVDFEVRYEVLGWSN